MHKSQGQTLTRALFDIKSGDIFSHGMLYVACSRVRHSNKFRVFVGPDNIDEKTGRPYVRNVVLQSLIQPGRINTHYFSKEMREAMAHDQAQKIRRQDLREAAAEGTRTERKKFYPDGYKSSDRKNEHAEGEEDPMDQAFHSQNLGGGVTAEIAKKIAEKIEQEGDGSDLAEARWGLLRKDDSDLAFLQADWRRDDSEMAFARGAREGWGDDHSEIARERWGSSSAAVPMEPRAKMAAKRKRSGEDEAGTVLSRLKIDDSIPKTPMEVPDVPRKRMGHQARVAAKIRAGGASGHLGAATGAASGHLGAASGNLGAASGHLGRGSWNAKGAASGHLGAAFGHLGAASGPKGVGPWNIAGASSGYDGGRRPGPSAKKEPPRN